MKTLFLSMLIGLILNGGLMGECGPSMGIDPKEGFRYWFQCHFESIFRRHSGDCWEYWMYRDIVILSEKSGEDPRCLFEELYRIYLESPEEADQKLEVMKLLI